MITITINSVDRTSDIDQASVQLRMALSKEPSVLSFVIKGNKSMPTLGQSILVTEDSDNLFSGTITERNESVIGNKVIGYSFTCKDSIQTMDRRLVAKAYNNTDAGTVVQDILDTYTTGFTLDIPGSTPAVETVRFNYEQPSQCFTKIANQIGWDWYVDADNVVHFFQASEEPAPFSVTDDNGKAIFNSIKFERNILELRNSVFVRGGEYLDPIGESDAVDRYEADGEQIAFPLVYRYGSVQVTVDGGAKTVGADFIDDPTDYDCLYNFQEKLVRFRDNNKPAAGEVVRVFGNAYVPLIVQAEDSDSIDTYGRYEGLEINKNINSIDEAELLANSLLEKWRDGSSEGSFRTREKGLRVGQTITIESTAFGVNDIFKINRIRGKMKDHESFEYEVEFIKSGQTTFTDLMLQIIGRDKDNIVISDNEVVQRFRTLSDTFGVTDEITEIIKNSPPYHWSPVTTGNAGKWNFATWS